MVSHIENAIFKDSNVINTAPALEMSDDLNCRWELSQTIYRNKAMAKKENLPMESWRTAGIWGGVWADTPNGCAMDV